MVKLMLIVYFVGVTWRMEAYMDDMETCRRLEQNLITNDRWGMIQWSDCVKRNAK